MMVAMAKNPMVTEDMFNFDSMMNELFGKHVPSLFKTTNIAVNSKGLIPVQHDRYRTHIDDSQMILEVDLPGFDIEETKLSVTGNRVTVNCHRGDVKQTAHFTISDDFDAKPKLASMANGQLRIVFSRVDRQMAVNIPIQKR